VPSLKLALRALWSSRLSSAAALVSFALGVGATVAIFSVLDALVLRPLPVAHPDELVTISSDMALRLGFDAGLGWNYQMWTRLRDRRDLAESALVWTRQSLAMATGVGRERVDALVGDGLFETLGIGTAAGRPIVAADEVKGGGPDGPVAVLGYDFWRRRFDGSPRAIGSRIQLERVPFTVVGVAPRDFLGVAAGQSFDVIVPLGTTPLLQPGRSAVDLPESLLLMPMLRLRPGQSLAAATRALRAAQTDLVGPGRLPPFVKAPFVLVPSSRGVSKGGTDIRDRYTRPLVVMLGVAAFVFLLACGNIANLLLARGVARRREFGIHLALGARPSDVMRAVALESGMLAIAGSALGLLTATIGARILVGAVSTSATRIALDLAIDWRVLAFTAIAAAGAAVFFGTLPAFRASRVPALEALRAPASPGTRRGLGGALLIAQVAASYALVVAAGLLTGTYGRLVEKPLGFSPANALVATVDTAAAAVTGSRLAYFDRLVASTRLVPGIEAAGASLQPPLTGGLPQEMSVSSQPASASLAALVRMVTPEWFHAIGTGIVRGRDFDDLDVAGAQPVAVVNDAFVRDLLHGREALNEVVNGRRIVGVVVSGAVAGGYRANGVSWSLRDAPPATLYVPLAQSGGMVPPDHTALTIGARGIVGSRDVGAGIAAALSGVDRDLTVTMKPLSDYVSDSLAQERVVAWLSGLFAALGLVLAGVGLYAMTAHLVNRQRAEIAIRLALGASGRDVFRTVLGRAMASLATGIVLGTIASFWLSGFLASLIYGVSPRDPRTIVSAIAVLAVIGLSTAIVPAVRASRVNPVEMLRRT
jgi:predicted permease